MTPAERRAALHTEFMAWLASERFDFGIMPSPQRMLKSPDSLTRRQRAWLNAHIAAVTAIDAEVQP